MGYPGNSTTQGHDVIEAPRKASTSFGRLKAATGFARSKPADSSSTLVLGAQDVLNAPSSAAPVANAGPSVLSANVEMTGSLVSPHELHIYGAVDGNVRASDLTIFAGGSVRGEVVAENVLVHGSVEGRIHGKKVQLCSGAVVRGDIIHASLGIDTGSTFEGVSKRSQDPQAEAKAALTKRNGAAADTGRHSSPSQ